MKEVKREYPRSHGAACLAFDLALRWWKRGNQNVKLYRTATHWCVSCEVGLN